MISPKGILIPIGGNELKIQEEKEDHQKIDFERGILRRIIKEIENPKPVIELLPIASSTQKEVQEIYTEAFHKIGHKINVMTVDDKNDIDNKSNLERIKRADCIFISGGDQVRLKRLLYNTEFINVLHEKYVNEPFVISGTSAGAMILSEYMIEAGASEESFLKGIIKLNKGFGFLPGTIIDTHFFNRGRFARLTEALLIKRKFTGIGISEDTALIIKNGNEFKAIGSGTVTIIDTMEIVNTNYDTVKDRDPVFIDNLRIHILSRGSGYLLKERQFKVLKKS